MSESSERPFSYLAWAVLTFTVLTILGGAIVRATGSGDGCGETWPHCTDRIFPINEGLEGFIEFGHRLMSGAAIIGVVALYVWARRLYERGDLVRWWATAALIFMVVESVIGASLVLFGWVDDDTSIARMIMVPLHLANTMLLIGSLTLTAWWSSGNPAPEPEDHRSTLRRLTLGAGGLILVALIGATNALGDTLYPADDFLSGVQDDFATGAPLLVQARILHPAVAILVGLAVAYLAVSLEYARTGRTQRLARIVAGLVLVQFAVGITNVFLATPLETQIVHLAMANALWIAYVLFSASLLGEPARVPSTVSSRS